MSGKLIYTILLIASFANREQRTVVLLVSAFVFIVRLVLDVHERVHNNKNTKLQNYPLQQ